MSDPISRLTTALADRYKIEDRLGEGGMACRAVRRTDGLADCLYA